jgi:RimJ/RimL family protein N-acetyltransferase
MGISSLAPLISKADLGISACGINTWERLCLGLPSIVITIAENQRPIAKVLSSLGLIKWLGDDLEVDEEKILVSLKAIIEKEVNPDWSKACFGIVDGLGANRVVAAMSAVENDLLTARPVSLVDEDLLLDWVNDRETRSSSFNSKKIDPLTHHSWMEKKLSSPATVYFYIVSVANKIPIGQVRFEAVDSDWEIHFSLASDFRSLGIAKYFLLAAIKKFREQVKIGEIFGRVKKENTSSSKLFEGLGFDVNELATGDEFLVFISRSL